MTVISLNNQSLFDIAAQEFGTIEAIFDLAVVNDLAITDELEVGQVLNLPNYDNSDADVVNWFKEKKEKPTTSNPEIEGQSEIKEGIGYWGIGSTFKVS